MSCNQTQHGRIAARYVVTPSKEKMAQSGVYRLAGVARLLEI